MKVPEGMTLPDFSQRAEAMFQTVIGGADAAAAGAMAERIMLAMQDGPERVAPATVLVTLAAVTGRFCMIAPPGAHPYQPAVMARLVARVMRMADAADGIGTPRGSA